jgi:hypothetical protein
MQRSEEAKRSVERPYQFCPEAASSFRRVLRGCRTVLLPIGRGSIEVSCKASLKRRTFFIQQPGIDLIPSICIVGVVNDAAVFGMISA